MGEVELTEGFEGRNQGAALANPVTIGLRIHRFNLRRVLAPSF